YEQTKDETLKTFAKSQIDYILGKNPANMSYIIGYGTNYPKHPHHRAANGYTYATGGITNEAKHVLLGSLVGGPDATDTYKDDVNQYQYTEVALDYNAGLVGALAGMQKNYGGTVSSPSPAATPTATPSIKPTATPSPSVAPTPTATPSSVPVSKTIPGTIEAENYDNMYGIQTESCVEGGLNVGWIDTGDWLDYNVNVQSEGTYTVEYRVASTQSTGKLALRKGTVNLASSSIPNTGGWQNWTTIKATVNLSAGTQTLRLYAEGSLFNINWIKFTSGSVSTASPTPTPTPTITPSIVPTPTSTPSIVPTPTKTPVPSVTPTSTPTPSASTAPVSGSIKVQMYNGNTSSSTNGIAPKFMITNTGTTSISLESVKIRYYYTIDGDKAQSFWCDWTSVGSSNVTGRFVKMSTAKTTADYYLEVGFISTAGSLSPGQSIEVQTRFSKSDWSNYNQSNDYSFRSTGTSYSDWNKVTGYVSGILNWGVEP
ncbi:MAG: glycoside hydrolase family 9 protein, partial [Bacillota bacterium]